MVPPSVSVPFNAEKLVEHRTQMDEFRSELVSLWNGTLSGELKTGAYRRTRLYEWTLPYDGLLQTYFVYPRGAAWAGKELARIAALFRRDNCQLLGSVVIWGADFLQYLPKSESKGALTSLKEAAQRTRFPSKSPVRLSVEGHSYWGTSIAWLSEAVLANQLVSQNLIVHSDLSGLACLRSRSLVEPEQSKTEKVPAPADKNPDSQSGLHRGHRQVRVVLEGSKASDQPWPIVQGRFSYIPLPLNVQLTESRGGELKATAFVPQSISDSVSNSLKELLHDLDDPAIQIVSREGRFVTVERGLAFGLRIGMHLEGPQGEKLHVIRFDKGSGLADAAILLIRSESKNAPLKKGDLLKVDQTVFPAR